MKDKITFLVAVLALLASFFLIFLEGGSEGRVYDCGMAEWHPDIPPVVKEECRRRALELWKQHQERIERSKPYI